MMIDQKHPQIHEIGTSFLLAIHVLGLFKLMKLCGFIRLRKAGSSLKRNTYSLSQIMVAMLTQIFCFPNLYRRLQSSSGSAVPGCGKDVFYEFMGNARYDWSKLVTQLASRVIRQLRRKMPKGIRACFIIDDTIIERPRAKKVELCARIFNHVTGRMVKGFTHLLLSWNDGRSTIPVSFSVLSSANAKNRCTEADEKVDMRTCGGKRRKEAVLKKPQMVIELLKRAIKAGIYADYVLMDSWFTTEPMLRDLRELGLHCVGMVKQLRQRYFLNGQSHTLNTLRDMVIRQRRSECIHNPDIIGSVCVTTKDGIEVRIVFVINRNKRSKTLSILSTDTRLSDDEIVRMYERRFSIEANFYNMKHHLQLTRETQCRCFDATVAYNALSIIRLIILEWIKRCRNDDAATIGGLFYLEREEQQLLPFMKVVSMLLHLLEQLPKKLMQSGVIGNRDILQMQDLIEQEARSLYDNSCPFIQNFMIRCGRKSLSEPYRDYHSAGKINTGF